MQRNVDRTVRLTALAVHQAVVIGTPVDTGRARSNWEVSLDVPAEGTREPFSPGDRLGSGERENASAALQEGQERVRAFSTLKNRSIHITNNLPYIRRLNEGHSAQAPAGFVEDAILAGEAVVRGARVLK